MNIDKKGISSTKIIMTNKSPNFTTKSSRILATQNRVFNNCILQIYQGVARRLSVYE